MLERRTARGETKEATVVIGFYSILQKLICQHSKLGQKEERFKGCIF